MPLVLSLLLIHLTSCATLKDSLLVGGTTGAALGGAAGSVIDVPRKNQTKSILFGAAIGSILGALGGYLKFKGKEKNEIKNIDQTTNNEIIKSESESAPFLSKPVVRKVWIPAKIEDEKFIEGHFIYLIERQSLWQN